jgi:hypothetical protein
VSDKYFRTPHAPWSLGSTSDDKRVASVDHLLGVEVVVTEKIDGENQTWTSDGVFARSHEGPPTHASNGWSKTVHAQKRHLIDPGLSVYMEYTYALHSIWYRRMAAERAYFHVIGVRDERAGTYWSWDDVELMASNLDLPTVPVLFRGVCCRPHQVEALMPGSGTSESAWGGVPIRMVGRDVLLAPDARPDGSVREGEVLRVASSFVDPAVSIVKAVRPNHVQSDEHWKKNWRPMHEWRPE